MENEWTRKLNELDTIIEELKEENAKLKMLLFDVTHGGRYILKERGENDTE